MTRALILAAGDGTRWGDFLGVPKHFAPVDGKPILHRTVDLLREYTDDIVIVARPEELERYTVINTATVAANLNPYRGEADKFLSSRTYWRQDERTMLIYGDCYFTEEAMRTIMSPAPYEDGWRLFCRFGENPWTGRGWGENFAFGLDPEAHDRFDSALGRMMSYEGRTGGWELYRDLVGMVDEEHGDYGHATDIVDWSDDLDYPADWVEMIARRAMR
jgi:hypothetical protein